MASAAIEAIAEYHNDVERSLRLFFSEHSPSFNVQFFGLTAAEIRNQLNARLEETGERSAFFVLTSLEAAFKVDYESRCRKRMKDPLSRRFREMYKQREMRRVRLENDIFEAWKEHKPETRALIAEVKSAFRFRDWLAHGRYWTPRLGRKYDFNFIYSLADDVLSNFPFESVG
jgi:hypothetical protein